MYEHMVCFNSDTCNTMKGRLNFVVRHLMDKQPDLIDFGCIFHHANLALKSAMKSLPIAIDSFLIDLSIKRKEKFKEFCDFVNIT